MALASEPLFFVADLFGFIAYLLIVVVVFVVV